MTFHHKHSKFLSLLVASYGKQGRLSEFLSAKSQDLRSLKTREFLSPTGGKRRRTFSSRKSLSRELPLIWRLLLFFTSNHLVCVFSFALVHGRRTGIVFFDRKTFYTKEKSGVKTFESPSPSNVYLTN